MSGCVILSKFLNIYGYIIKAIFKQNYITTINSTTQNIFGEI